MKYVELPLVEKNVVLYLLADLLINKSDICENKDFIKNVQEKLDKKVMLDKYIFDEKEVQLIKTLIKYNLENIKKSKDETGLFMKSYLIKLKLKFN